MEIEYTNNKNYKFAYLISNSEKKVLLSALRRYKTSQFKKIDKEIEAIENDEENEGQCTYRDQIHTLSLEKNEINNMIRMLE